MRKKGLTYVDWAISIGIFLVYFILVFVLFKPGVREEYNPEYLFSIIEDNLEKNAYHEVEKVMLFVTPTASYTDRYLKLFFPYDRSDWLSSKILIIDKNGNELPFHLNLVEDNGNYKNFTFEASLTLGEKEIFYLIHAKEESFFYTEPSYQNMLVSPDDFTYQFSVKETLKGLSKRKFSELNDNYNDLKEEWNYPTSKEFEIMVFNALTQEGIVNYSKVQIPEDTNIYVLQKNDFLLSSNSSKTPIIVRLRVW